MPRRPCLRCGALELDGVCPRCGPYLAPSTRERNRTPKYRRALRARAGDRCERCGAAGVPLVIHHKTPAWAGGATVFENLELICERCHNDSHANGH